MASGKREDVPLVKLMLLGDTMVGKSSMLVRYTDGVFEDKTYMTLGMDFKTKNIEQDGRSLRIDVWDTAGQERFRSIQHTYYRSAMGVLFTYDITVEDTFDHVEEWMRNLEKYNGPDVPKILVGNKADLEELRTVAEDRGRELAERHKMPFLETSAKSGQNVNEAFEALARLVVQQRYSDSPAPRTEGGSVQLKPGTANSSKGCKC